MLLGLFLQYWTTTERVMERHELFRGNARRVQYPSSQSDISNEAASLRRLLNEPERLRIETECVEALIADYEHRIAYWDYFEGATTASKFSLGLLAGHVLLRVAGPRFLRARQVAYAKGITLLASLGLGIRACMYLISSSHRLIDRKSPRARLRAIQNGLSIETKEIFDRLAYLLDVSVGRRNFSSFGTYKTFTQTTPARPTYPIYKQLNGCSGWLRVLEVLPGCPGTMVECQLHMVFGSGSGSGSYEALSYVWGDSTQKEKLRVNGIVIEITQNLASALQCVRDRNISRRLWVDAICINQTDEEEKNDQVAKMAYIFRGSKRVLTFLGPDDDCSEVFDYLDSVKPGSESGITLRVLKAFWALLLKPWWSRIWVIQEFICAPELVVGCGRRWVNEAKFFEGFEKLKTELLLRIEEQPQSTLSHLGSASLVSVRKVLNMRHALLNRRMEPSTNLPDLFRETRGYLASDPRDKIFAINLFMPEPFRMMLRPNYTQTRETVYTRLTTILLSIIGWSELYMNYSLSRDGSLPSWVPDYSQPYSDGADLGRMSGQVSGTREIECSVAHGTLSIQGFEIDSIEKVHAVHEHNAILLYREFLRIESQIEREFQIEKKHQGFHTPLQDLVKEPLLHIAMGEQTSPTRKEGDGTIPDQENQQKKDLHISNFVNSASHCSVFTTKHGLVGVGTPDAKRGDKLILLFGMPTPFILRTGPGSYNMVGLGRAGGIMHGELMEHFESGFFQEQTFFID